MGRASTALPLHYVKTVSYSCGLSSPTAAAGRALRKSNPFPSELISSHLLVNKGLCYLHLARVLCAWLSRRQVLGKRQAPCQLFQNR